MKGNEFIMPSENVLFTMETFIMTRLHNVSTKIRVSCHEPVLIINGLMIGLFVTYWKLTNHTTFTERKTFRTYNPCPLHRTSDWARFNTVDSPELFQHGCPSYPRVEGRTEENRRGYCDSRQRYSSCRWKHGHYGQTTGKHRRWKRRREPSPLPTASVQFRRRH